MGSSMSLMSLSIYQKLGFGKVSNTRTSKKFTDHFTMYAYGVTKHVLVTIEEFRFPVDFLIMDMPEDQETLIVLCRPFLLTSRCNIEMEKGMLTLKFYDDEITLNVLKNKKQEGEKRNHYQVGMIKTCVEIPS